MGTREISWGNPSVNKVLATAISTTVLDCSGLYMSLWWPFHEVLVSSPDLAVQWVQCQPESSGDNGSSIPPYCYSLALFSSSYPSSKQSRVLCDMPRWHVTIPHTSHPTITSIHPYLLPSLSTNPQSMSTAADPKWLFILRLIQNFQGFQEMRLFRPAPSSVSIQRCCKQKLLHGKTPPPQTETSSLLPSSQ